MAQTEEEIIEALKGQIEQYEKLLEETVAEPKSFAKVVAGPFEEKGKKYYRVSKGSDVVMAYLSDVPLIGSDDLSKDLPCETEVLLVGQTIAAVVPEELKVVIEPPVFDLI